MSKDIRFTEKKVDDSWKEQATREKDVVSPVRPASSGEAPRASAAPKKSSHAFLNLLSSLGYQAMFHLGELPDPQTGEAAQDLQAAKEVIDLLAALKEKTAGNLSVEENQVLESILPELQMKFSQKA